MVKLKMQDGHIKFKKFNRPRVKVVLDTTLIKLLVYQGCVLLIIRKKQTNKKP
jgi:hypothetical protein